MPQRTLTEVPREHRPTAMVHHATVNAEAAVVEAALETSPQPVLTVVAEPTPEPPKPAKAPKVKAPKPAKVKTPKPAKVKTPKVKAPKPAKPPKVREPKPAKPRFELLDGERVEFSTHGWARMLPATLMITTYRVALTRLGRTRWIPLEEVRKTKAGKRTFLAEASIEQLILRARGGAATVAQAMDAALREARRPNSPRHHAAVTQEWCDRCEIWDTHTGRIRLWLNRHPVMIITLVAAVAAFVRVYLGPH
jgi:hypothetical protein